MERLALRDWGRFIARAALRVGDAWRRYFLMRLPSSGSISASDSNPRDWQCAWRCEDTAHASRQPVRIEVSVLRGDRMIGRIEFEALPSEDVDATQMSLVSRLSDFLLDHLLQLA